MDVRIEPVSEVEKKLIVEVPWALVSSKLGAAYKELGKSVQLKGFRKGKVPRSVLESVYGKRVKAEVAEQLVRDSFLHATSEQELEAVSMPKVDELPLIKKGQPLTFEAVVEVKGEVKIETFEGLELEKRPLKVSEEQVEQQLENLRKQQTELVPIEGRDAIENTDMVMISIKGKIGDRDFDQPQLSVELDEVNREPLPGLNAALLGLPLSATDHELTLKVPEDFSDKEIAGTEISAVVTVLDARAKVIPALDDEFAKDIDRGETLAELRDSVRKEIEEQTASEIADELRKAAVSALVKANQIPVADALVERAVDNMCQRMAMMLGINPSEGMSGEMRESMRPGALDEVRGQLLTEALADMKSIEVSDEDIDAKVAEFAARMNQKPAKLRSDMERDGRLDNLKFQLRQDKAADVVISKAKVTEKEPEATPGHGEDGHVHDENCNH